MCDAAKCAADGAAGNDEATPPGVDMSWVAAIDAEEDADKANDADATGRGGDDMALDGSDNDDDDDACCRAATATDGGIEGNSSSEGKATDDGRGVDACN